MISFSLADVAADVAAGIDAIATKRHQVISVIALSRLIATPIAHLGIRRERHPGVIDGAFPLDARPYSAASTADALITAPKVSM